MKVICFHFFSGFGMTIATQMSRKDSKTLILVTSGPLCIHADVV